MATVTLAEYEKAIGTLSEALLLFDNSAEGSVERRAFRDTCIQRFEFCVELAWKVAKKTMGTNSSAPKTVVREMAQDNLIEDPAVWLSFVDARNKSSHTYDDDIAQEVFAVVRKFPEEGIALLKALEVK